MCLLSLKFAFQQRDRIAVAQMHEAVPVQDGFGAAGDRENPGRLTEAVVRSHDDRLGCDSWRDRKRFTDR